MAVASVSERQLQGCRPLQLLATEAGARHIEELLYRIDEGMAASNHRIDDHAVSIYIGSCLAASIPVHQKDVVTPITVFIAVSVRVYREGLSEVLGQREDLTIAAAQAVEFETVSRIAELRPDVVILDMANTQSFAIGRNLHQSVPEVSVIGLGVGEAHAEMIACAEVGITGFVTPDASMEELVSVVKQVAQGQAIYSPQLAAGIVRRLATLSADQQPVSPQADLTRREREIAALIGQDLSNKEIANALGIEVATVKNHVHSLLQKLSVSRRSEAVACLTRHRRTLGIASFDQNRRLRS